jgi:hypothetical protein
MASYMFRPSMWSSSVAMDEHIQGLITEASVQCGLPCALHYDTPLPTAWLRYSVVWPASYSPTHKVVGGKYSLLVNLIIVFPVK